MEDFNNVKNKGINNKEKENLSLKSSNQETIKHTLTSTKTNLVQEETIFPENSYIYIFHINIDLLYNTFITQEFLPNIFFNKSKISSIKNNTNLAEEGNEIEIETSINHNKFKIKVINSINTPFYKSFTHDIIEKPTLFAGFTTTFNFFWDSIEQVSILQIIIIIKDTLYKTSIADYMFSRHNQKSKIISDYLEEKFKNFEQSESISINRNIYFIWNFLIDYNNIKFFFGDGNCNHIEIGILFDRDNEIEIIDRDKNNKIRVLISSDNNNNNENEKEILFQIISSLIPIPKQRIIIKLIKIDEFKTMVFFSHQIIQYIDYDILGSYSFIKKKALWEIKNLLEN